METKEKSANQLRDLKLVSAVINGGQNESDAAFAQIYKRYADNLMFQFLRSTKGDYPQSQDLVVETMAKVFKGMSKFNPEEGAFSTWLFRLGTNQFIDYIRGKKVEVLSIESLSTKTEDDLMEFQIEDKSSPSPEQVFNKKHRVVITREAVASIKNQKYRDVMIMRYFDELSYREIVTATGIPKNSVKNIIHRSVEDLKGKLKKELMP